MPRHENKLETVWNAHVHMKNIEGHRLDYLFFLCKLPETMLQAIVTNFL